MATKKKAKKAAKKSTARARKAAPARKAAKKRAAAAKAPKRRKVRAAARKPAAAKKPARAKARATAKAKPAVVRRRDRPGHIDPKYGKELRTRSEPPEPDPESFFGGPHATDDLSEEMGEEVVSTATTGEYEAEQVREQDVPEEVGGPFVETTGREEYGHGTDPSNPKGATREPFPRT
jgi:hypothetical protein